MGFSGLHVHVQQWPEGRAVGCRAGGWRPPHSWSKVAAAQCAAAAAAAVATQADCVHSTSPSVSHDTAVAGPQVTVCCRAARRALEQPLHWVSCIPPALSCWLPRARFAEPACIQLVLASPARLVNQRCGCASPGACLAAANPGHSCAVWCGWLALRVCMTCASMSEVYRTASLFDTCWIRAGQRETSWSSEQQACWAAHSQPGIHLLLLLLHKETFDTPPAGQRHAGYVCHLGTRKHARRHTCAQGTRKQVLAGLPSY